MDTASHLLTCRVETQCYALPLSSVERVVRAVYVTPLPEAPPSVLGVIDVQGEIVPVISARRRFGLAERGVEPGDQFIIVRTTHGMRALVVDGVHDVVRCPDSSIAPAEEVMPGTGCVEGMLSLGHGVALLCSPQKLLSPEDEARLDRSVHR